MNKSLISNNMNNICYKIVLLFTLVAYEANAYAYDFKVDGICYNIINDESKEVSVTYELNSYNEFKGYDGDIFIPSSVTYQGITYNVVAIGGSAFAEEEQDWNFDPWSSLTSVTISDGIKTIGHGAFHDCVVLKKVKLPSTLESIGGSAFYECRELQSLEIPNGVTKLETYTFGWCKKMHSIVIPKSMESINCSFPDWGTLSVVISKIENPFDIDLKSADIFSSV